MDTEATLLAELCAYGLLLQQDLQLPSVVTLVAGAPLHGSWWSHPAGHTIFSLLNALAAHPDVLVTHLVRGKVTFVHRRLWPAVLVVATERAAWQFARLPASFMRRSRARGCCLQPDETPKSLSGACWSIAKKSIPRRAITNYIWKAGRSGPSAPAATAISRLLKAGGSLRPPCRRLAEPK